MILNLKKPRICVLIPAHNEELTLGRSIKSLFESGIDPSDIYVINDYSTDNTANVATKLGVNILNNIKNIGKGGSIEHGIKELKICTNYEFALFLDADTVIDKDYFYWTMERFGSDYSIVAVPGQPKSIQHNWLTAHRALQYFTSCSIYKGGQSAMGVITVAPGCSTTFKTKVLPELNWNNGTLVEDMDVTMQIYRKKLGKIAYEPKAVVHTQDPMTISDYWKQMNRWYCGTWQVAKNHNVPFGFSRIDIELLFLLAEGMIFGLLFTAIPLIAIIYPNLISLLIITDQTILLLFALMLGIRDKRSDVLRFFWSFIFLRFVDCFVLLLSFWKIIIQDKKRIGWFSPARY
ncbi:MAG: hypothetical protein COV29_03855 [Candidatus Yanofskybacteria bacterium CG10_big_fil_rev_8_21_14_0_10_36_16]|uniref:Glycosyltransferase 2-like domain-containing protein n=1 Tax=Candidatus Yanofskybacteria bacterium CG10_big_fil_rev_8_21_14_0_10_36_16 TaxID=1975096 RepID=A0A2J0Q6N2_9BACT|nr:MAG: hypothetical protein COV29_03855 [Candidatus Yanofskybacteria bacterium CG10_big_fil_rev_8_21_14_0_10_36_16]